MVYMINSVELTGYNGERSVRNLEHIKMSLRTVNSCPNMNVKLQDEWLRRFNDLEERLHQGSTRFERLMGLIKNIQWVKIKFNYTSYYG